jgi:integrative and conjugative element protein (TIGR02256 family)
MRAKSLIEPLSKRLVVISEEVLELIWKHRQVRAVDCEAGGVLIGKRRGDHLEVTAASPPQARDVRSRSRFTRFQEGHQQITEDRWLASDGEDNYLGEWHTHPEISASPSSIDMREWKKLSCNYDAPLVVIIGGLEKFYFGLMVGTSLLTLEDSSLSSPSVSS